MAELNEQQKREIVEALACFATPASVVVHFFEEYGIALDRRQVGGYDPTRPYYEAGDKWREVFDATRRAYLEDVQAVPAANQGYRLQVLQEGIEAARKQKNWALASQLLEQAAKEVGGVLTNVRQHKVDDRRSALSELSPDERRMALAELVRQAMEQAPARLAPPIEGKATEV